MDARGTALLTRSATSAGMLGAVSGYTACAGRKPVSTPPNDPARLIVVDDEPEIRAMVADYLGRDGYTVCRCASGPELDAVLETGPVDLVVLDVSMPGEDGLSIARRLRAFGSTPIIMLTALDDVVDRIVGLEVGADDYLTKPFDLRELRARVRAVLRRVASTPGDDRETPQAIRDVAPFGKVHLDLDGHCLVDGEGKTERLTATEFDLLKTFAENPNRVMSRERLLDTTFGRDDPLDRSIDIRIARIRKKVELDAAKPQVIKTVRGAGYIYVPSQDAA
jgi:DNA-binding response OmpR family regulator